MSKPLVIDLCCGLGGWTKGFLAEGYEAVGFDIERHQYGEKRYPAQLVLQDITTLHGSQFRNAAVIVASPPCQEYSYRAMPWKRAKALPPPDNTLFETCFRIQREANEANGVPCSRCLLSWSGRLWDCPDCASRRIPLLVENVCGAQRWVGRAAWHYGSYYLWGDVPALMPFTRSSVKVPGQDWNNYAKTGEVSPHWRLEADGVKRVEPKGTDVPADGTGKTSWFFGARSDPRDIRGVKQEGSGAVWFDVGLFRFSSRGSARKAASALIAEIPFDLAQHIARVFKPESAFSMPMHQAGRSPAIQGVA